MTDRTAGEEADRVSSGMIQQLCDIEEIRLLKHRHVRCVDLKLWEEIGDTLTADALFGTGTSAFGKPVEISGRAGIVTFFRARLGPAVLTEHSASQPEISVAGDTATGIWSHREMTLATEHRMIIASTGFSDECYERGADARWRIARIRSVRICEVILSLDDLPSFRLIAAHDGSAVAASAETER